jgi:two-component system NtrC family sensor kinase
MNLVTNAFYTVDERKLNSPQPPEGGTQYEPKVTISTKKLGDKVEIRVIDNGTAYQHR